jgi:hypothetical protein
MQCSFGASKHLGNLISVTKHHGVGFGHFPLQVEESALKVAVLIILRL